MSDLDAVVQRALTGFTHDVFASGWWGKEREAVSLFAFGYLIAQCRHDSVLFDPAQVGIEVRVLKPDDPSLGIKPEVCKDLVIWNQPRGTVWNGSPLAVLEWKANEKRVSPSDVQWLAAFSKGKPDFTGYAICLDMGSRNFRLSCTRVQEGQSPQGDWLVL